MSVLECSLRARASASLGMQMHQRAQRRTGTERGAAYVEGVGSHSRGSEERQQGGPATRDGRAGTVPGTGISIV